MNDDLKKFIDNNKRAFDSEMPSAKVWANIDAQLSNKKNIPLHSLRTFRLSVAAAVVLLTIVSATIFYEKRNQPLPTSTDTESGLYEQEMLHYAQLIRIKYKEIESIKTVRPDLYQRFSADLHKLDSNYQQLKAQLPDNPNQEVLLAAMIQNLTLEIELLNQQLTIIHQINESKKQTHETHTNSL